MDFTEQQIFEALGVSPGAEGANGQETAAPAAQESQEAQAQTEETPAPESVPVGEKEQEVAAPAPESADSPQDEATAPAGREQTEEERRENAAQRRRAETQAAVDQAVREAVEAERARAKDEMSAFFATANLKNTLTGAPITTMEEFHTWKTAFDAARLEKELQSGKLTQEGLNLAIAQNPTVKRAEEVIRQSEEARQKAEMEAVKAKAEAELAEIRKMDPSIQTMQDLLKMPRAKEFYDYVKRGNTFLDAYRLSHWDELEAKRAEAARQQAMSNARSKEHLAPVNARGGGAASVPGDVMAMFRLFDPDSSEAEIQAYYNKCLNDKNGG